MADFYFRLADKAAYKLKNPRQIDAQRAGEFLSQFPRRDPHVILERINQRDTCVDQHFEWDDSAAAWGFRLDQVRELLRVIVTVNAQTGDEMPAFVSISARNVPRQYYTPQEIRNDNRLFVAMMREADRKLEEWQHRYRSLAHLQEEPRRRIQDMIHRNSDAGPLHPDR